MSKATMKDLHEALNRLTPRSRDTKVEQAAKLLHDVQAAGRLDLDDLNAHEMEWVDQLQFIDTREQEE